MAYVRTGVLKKRTTPTTRLSLTMMSLGLISIGPLQPTIYKQRQINEEYIKVYRYWLHWGPTTAWSYKL